MASGATGARRRRRAADVALPAGRNSPASGPPSPSSVDSRVAGQWAVGGGGWSPRGGGRVLHDHAPRQGRHRRSQRRRQDQPVPGARRRRRARRRPDRAQGRLRLPAAGPPHRRRPRRSHRRSPTSSAAAASTRSWCASRSSAWRWRKTPTSATSPATPSAEERFGANGGYSADSEARRSPPASASAPTASTCRSGCSRAASAGGSSSPASCSPAPTCCCSTSRRTTSTSTPRPG